ncbi:50S ribosomal protein L6 [Enterobacteriaceae endosymbiont of Neohaemonia nigricornis]|uniref:50S ribosomal protein L6 n=1 Tax=Enterobacteriaceae endosymbiont of Neohaemonia nigricornis TaxID=2675792 RepID=UPI001449FCF0|nr:50S ribosomal protein L6 [Enterobacteriaceae endosymbiont of Neohaemonia nigricornis]QJC30455.1 50S ribosomal protein L6 [Enterobacteriaceae endosymbiont of Neohaemonia nigricornis]
MSRIAKKPIIIPNDIQVMMNNNTINIQGIKGVLKKKIHKSVNILIEKNKIICLPKDNKRNSWAHAGTSCSIINSMIIGITQGFTKKLILFGIGYKVSINNNIIDLILGFSHHVFYTLPNGITGKCYNTNEIILYGFDKQLLGQVASDIRAYKKPEPYKGKGIRYEHEIVRIKETKKK